MKEHINTSSGLSYKENFLSIVDEKWKQLQERKLKEKLYLETCNKRGGTSRKKKPLTCNFKGNS
jgi:predicted HicB family RNase H-like nuclease